MSKDSIIFSKFISCHERVQNPFKKTKILYIVSRFFHWQQEIYYFLLVLSNDRLINRKWFLCTDKSLKIQIKYVHNAHAMACYPLIQTLICLWFYGVRNLALWKWGISGERTKIDGKGLIYIRNHTCQRASAIMGLKFDCTPFWHVSWILGKLR